MKSKIVTLRFEDDDAVKEFINFLTLKKMCGQLNPDFDPVDKVAMIVFTGLTLGAPVLYRKFKEDKR